MTDHITHIPWPIESLLPHDHPMILIDAVRDWTQDGLIASVRIAENSPFYEQGRGVPTWAGIEYMAQTVAAYAGVRARKAGQAVRIGFLLGTRRYSTSQSYFALGAGLAIHILREFEDQSMGRFACDIRDSADNILVTAAINVYLPDEENMRYVEAGE